MANSIALFKKYTDRLDTVYRKAALTAILESDTSLVREGANANELVIPKLSMSGMGDYDRGAGYSRGDVTLEFETIKADYDRGREFLVDALDNKETAGLAYGKLSAEFIRTKCTPELDAHRFASYSAAPNIQTAVAAILAGGAAVLDALVEATNKMDEEEVPSENRILFITPTNLNAIKALDTTKSREILDSFAHIIKVPQSRFYTAIDLFDGKSEGEAAGGYKKADGGADINFMIIHKDAVAQFTKHKATKAFSPDNVQGADGWLFDIRVVAVNEVYENKAKGIYLHHKPVA